MADRSGSGLVVVCLLSVLAVTSVHALYEHTCTLENRQELSPSGICGTRLANAVDAVCRMQGGYVQKWYRKRSERGLLTEAEFKDVLLGKKDAASYLHGARGRRAAYGEQGITCECCFNQCSLKELSQYCRSSAPSGVDYMPRKK